MNLVYSLFNRRDLTNLRVRAIRRGMWFKALNRMERGLIDSVIKVVDNVRSKLLAKVLNSIVTKLMAVLECKLHQMMREVGQPLAQRISRLAQSWGNRAAYSWGHSKKFIQFLTILTINANTWER